MGRSSYALAVVGCVLFTAAAPAQSDPRARRLQGTWELVSMEVAGKAAPPEAIRGRILTIGGANLIARQGGAIVQTGIFSTPASGDRRYINATILQGQDAGSFLLGIYQLRDDQLTLCWDTSGVDRPTGLESRPGTNQVLAVYRRRLTGRADDQSIAGVYRSESTDDRGNKSLGQAIIERQGDSYQVLYQSGGGVAFVGIGIRDGDTFSVCWRNQGQFGISVYQIGEGRAMKGRYTILGGSGQIHEEKLIPDDGV